MSLSPAKCIDVSSQVLSVQKRKCKVHLKPSDSVNVVSQTAFSGKNIYLQNIFFGFTNTTEESHAGIKLGEIW